MAKKKAKKAKRKTTKKTKKTKKSKKSSTKKKALKTISLKNFMKRYDHYLTSYYWPHWSDYYTHTYNYPYYSFYWFFYNHYHTHLHYYYDYYFEYHPFVNHFHHSNYVFYHDHNPIILTTTSDTHLLSAKPTKYKISKCDNGPKKMVSVKKGGKKFRIFLGDANDLVNLGCLYFMDAVVSAGKSSYGKRVENMYKQQKKKLDVKGVKITVTPFKKSPFIPKKVSIKNIDRNAQRINFTLERKGKEWKGKKSILFYHLYSKDITSSKDAKKIINGLAKNTKKKVSNVLFIADHLEPYSLYLWKYLLTVYGKYELTRIWRITYRRIRLFSGIIMHKSTRWPSSVTTTTYVTAPTTTTTTVITSSH